ncbi:hypothetical protein DUI87_05639 [Hirundo rustica rustica]|uniref:Uncharacterized protein n=1 Tax=Hirundo rustica rustica TaxID=333673 RepID=A0A3M0KV92_HIRRU|nr:hypothetical protein DUI87_05639 [Hirundo rustica rustica]
MLFLVHPWIALAFFALQVLLVKDTTHYPRQLQVPSNLALDTSRCVKTEIGNADELIHECSEKDTGRKTSERENPEDLGSQIDFRVSDLDPGLSRIPGRLAQVQKPPRKEPASPRDELKILDLTWMDGHLHLQAKLGWNGTGRTTSDEGPGFRMG